VCEIIANYKMSTFYNYNYICDKIQTEISIS